MDSWIGWIMHDLIKLLNVWFIDCLIAWLTDWLNDGLIGRLVEQTTHQNYPGPADCAKRLNPPPPRIPPDCIFAGRCCVCRPLLISALPTPRNIRLHCTPETGCMNLCNFRLRELACYTPRNARKHQISLHPRGGVSSERDLWWPFVQLFDLTPLWTSITWSKIRKNT